MSRRMSEERKRDDEDEISIKETASVDESEETVSSNKKSGEKRSFLWLRGVYNGIAKSLFLAALLMIPALIINACAVNTEVVQVSLFSPII